MTPDSDFAVGTAPPNRRADGFRFSRDFEKGFETGVKPPNRRADSNLTGRYEYVTHDNRTILSLDGPLDLGHEIFMPRDNWKAHPVARDFLRTRDDTEPNDDCTGTAARDLEAVSLLPREELGSFDVIARGL
jgi:hypothetical protein